MGVEQISWLLALRTLPLQVLSHSPAELLSQYGAERLPQEQAAVADQEGFQLPVKVYAPLTDNPSCKATGVCPAPKVLPPKSALLSVPPPTLRARGSHTRLGGKGPSNRHLVSCPAQKSVLNF